MQDDAGLVEVMARALFNHWRHPAQRSWQWGVDLPQHVTAYWRQGAREALAAIRATGFVIVPEPVEFTREQTQDILRVGLTKLENNVTPNPAFRAAPKQG